MKQKQYWAYILTDARSKIFYTGMTDDLYRRNYEHKMGVYEGFTKKYRVHKLVYFELLMHSEEAAKREKMIKKWKRSFKINAIERMNPDWNNLYFSLDQPPQQVRG